MSSDVQRLPTIQPGKPRLSFKAVVSLLLAAGISAVPTFVFTEVGTGMITMFSDILHHGAAGLTIWSLVQGLFFDVKRSLQSFYSPWDFLVFQLLAFGIFGGGLTAAVHSVWPRMRGGPRTAWLWFCVYLTMMSAGFALSFILPIIERSPHVLPGDRLELDWKHLFVLILFPLIGAFFGASIAFLARWIERLLPPWQGK